MSDINKEAEADKPSEHPLLAEVVRRFAHHCKEAERSRLEGWPAKSHEHIRDAQLLNRVADALRAVTTEGGECTQFDDCICDREDYDYDDEAEASEPSGEHEHKYATFGVLVVCISCGKAWKPAGEPSSAASEVHGRPPSGGARP